MMLRTAILATTALLALAATSCSSAAPPPAQGDLEIHVSPASSPPNGDTCTVDPHNAQIGDQAPSGTSPGSRVRDGNSGAVVQCSVKGSSTFSVNAAIRKGAVSFQLLGKVPKTGDGTGSIISFDPTSDMTMSSPSGTPCTISPIQIAAGRIWAHFVCNGFVNPSAPTNSYCQADGYFVFENCDQ